MILCNILYLRFGDPVLATAIRIEHSKIGTIKSMKSLLCASEFCDAAALNTGAAGTYLIGNVYDIGLVNYDIGNGEDMFAVILVSTTVLSGGAATVQFHVDRHRDAAYPDHRG